MFICDLVRGRSNRTYDSASTWFLNIKIFHMVNGVFLLGKYILSKFIYVGLV